MHQMNEREHQENGDSYRRIGNQASEIVDSESQRDQP